MKGYGSVPAVGMPPGVLGLPHKLTVHMGLWIVSTLCGGGQVVSKLGMHTCNPVMFELLREALAIPLLYGLSSFFGEGKISANGGGRRMLPDEADVPRLLLAGLCLFSNQISYFVGLKVSGPFVGAIWSISLPIWTAILAALSGLEQISMRKALGIITAAGGAFYIVIIDAAGTGGGAGKTGGSFGMVGHALFFWKCISISTYLFVCKGLTTKYQPLSVSTWCFCVSCILFFMAQVMVSSSTTLSAFVCWNRSYYIMEQCMSGVWQLNTEMVGPLLYEALVCTVIVSPLSLWTNKHAKATEVTVYMVMQPITVMMLSMALIVNFGSAWSFSRGIMAPASKDMYGVFLIFAGLFMSLVEKSASPLEHEAIIAEDA
jgi:drug/metabolite transporter (DMT)-like permease